MFHKREKPLPAEQNPVEPEKTPEYSRETLMMVESIDNGLTDSENLLSGLGRLAREKIITDSKGLEEIYAPKEIGKLDLKKYDASIFKPAGIGLKIRNAINLGQYKYALRSEEGVVVDTRKLKKDAEGEKYELNADELKKIKKRAEKFGLNPEEINSQNLKTTFIEGKKGAEKIILREKTEQEADETAGNILERRLKELETKTGADLIKQRENLDEFRKEKQQHQSILDEASMARLDDEEIMRREMIEEKQETLKFDLEIIRSPLLERQKVLDEALADFSSLAAEITSQEKTYQAEIKGLQDKITKIKGTKQIGQVLGDKVREWEEEKAQTEVNLKDFKEKKEALNRRIIELKKNQAEVNAALDRINNIGKTKQELKAEKAAKQREKLEQQKKNRAYQEQNPTPELTFASTESEEVGGEEAARVAGAAAGTSPVVSVPESKKPEAKAYATLEQPQAIEPAEEKIIKMRISEWLDLLGLKNAVGSAKTAVENNFKVDKIFNLNSSMALDQARQNYTQYLVDFQKIPAVRAQRQANAKFEEIIKKLSV